MFGAPFSAQVSFGHIGLFLSGETRKTYDTPNSMRMITLPRIYGERWTIIR